MPTPRGFNVIHGLRVGTKEVVTGSGILADVGDISLLETTDKTSIVDALNEVEGSFNNITTAQVAEDPAYLYYTDTRSRGAVSVTDTGGDGSLAYDNGTGVFTYTGPSASEVRAHFTGGTGVTITDGTIAIGQSVGVTDNVSFANTTLTGVLYGPSQFVIDPAAQGDATGEVIILGDLTVEGTTTTINSTVVEIEDKVVTLAKSATTPTEANNAGIEVAGAGASLLYAFTTDSWNPNKVLKGVDGSESSPAFSFATDPGLGLYRSADNQLSLATNGLERFRLSDTTATLVGSVDLILNRGTYSGTLTTTTLSANRTYTLPNVNGTLVTTGDTGTVTSAMIANGTIVNEDINASAGIVDTKLATISTADKVSISSLNIDGGTDIGAALSDADLFIVDDGGSGTNRKAAVTRITNYTFGKVSGDITISSTGTAAISSGVIVDADVSATAEIAVSKLADGSARQLLQTDAAGTGVEWTSNVDIPGTLDVTGISTFDNLISIGAAEPTTSQQVGWNTDKGTLDIGLLNGVISPLGQDIITLCRNDTASTIAKGTAVMFAGTTGNSGRLKIAPMVSNGTYPGYVFFGVTAQAIAAGADGYVRSFGEIKGVNTDINEGGVGGQWVQGDILWCNPATPGGFTKFEPQAPNLKLPVAAVVSVGNNGIILTRWDTGRRISDLHDVDANGMTANGELLVYNSSAERWEHGSTVPSLTVTESLVVNGIEIIDSARDVEESRLIRKYGTATIGLPGTVPFGVGPVIPPGMSLAGIGPDSYNVIDVYSGSVC